MEKLFLQPGGYYKIFAPGVIASAAYGRGLPEVIEDVCKKVEAMYEAQTKYEQPMIQEHEVFCDPEE